jgi:glycosyltransferase involved in cell wall biosynthesis
MTPRIGIVVRTTGRATLRQALQSIRDQAVDFEPGSLAVWLVEATGTACDRDDNSVPGHSAAMLKAALGPVPWQLVRAGRPLLRAQAAQAGWTAARTDRVAFLDDDDLWLPGHLARLDRALDAAPQAVVAHAGVQLRSLKPDTEPADSTPGYVWEGPFEPWDLLVANRLPIHAALVQADRLRAAGVGFDATLPVYEDWDFWLQARAVGDFIAVPGISAWYLHRADPAQSTASAQSWGDAAHRTIWWRWVIRAPAAWWQQLSPQTVPSADERDRVQALQAWWADAGAASKMRKDWAGSARPMLSILMPVHNPPVSYLLAAIESVWAQDDADWELCLADDASTDPAVLDCLNAAVQDPRSAGRVRLHRRRQNGGIAEATNTAWSMARGAWLGFLDHDDVLGPGAVGALRQTLTAHPDARWVYTDEDRLLEDGSLAGRFEKRGWDPLLLRSQNYVCHFTMVRADLMSELGGLRGGYDGSQDHEWMLRAAERVQPHEVLHIPECLYHWRVHPASTASGLAAKPLAFDASRRAVQAHLDHVSPGARAEWDAVLSYVRVHPAPPETGSVWIDRLRRVDTEQLLRELAEAADPAEAGANADAGADKSFDAAEPACWLWCDGVEAPDASALHEMLGLAREPFVGLVAAAVWEPDGCRADIGWQRRPDGICEPEGSGLARGEHGVYARASLPHAVEAAAPGCLLMTERIWRRVRVRLATRGALAWGGLPGERVPLAERSRCLALWLSEAVRAEGLLVAWTPQAEVRRAAAAGGLSANRTPT